MKSGTCMTPSNTGKPELVYIFYKPSKQKKLIYSKLL